MKPLMIGLYLGLLALLGLAQWNSSSEAALTVRLAVVWLPGLVGLALLLLPPRPRYTASSLPMLLYFCITSVQWVAADAKWLWALTTLISSAYLLVLGGWGWRGLKAKRAAQALAAREASTEA